LLVSWCVGGRCGMASGDENRGRSRRSGTEDRGWAHKSGTRWSHDREVGYAVCAVCTVLEVTKSTGFLVEP
jgi:hypothetical protein